MAIPVFESITVTGSAVGFTAANLKSDTSKVWKVFLTLETAEIRFRLDGTAPTSAEGHIMSSGDTLELTDPDGISNFKAIKTGGTSGVLKVTYEYNQL